MPHSKYCQARSDSNQGANGANNRNQGYRLRPRIIVLLTEFTIHCMHPICDGQPAPESKSDQWQYDGFGFSLILAACPSLL